MHPQAKKAEADIVVFANDSDLAAATGIRQLIANGKSKTALDRAREIHKARPTPASEALLIEAYTARIEGLQGLNLIQEADALLALVRERFPAAIDRLAALSAASLARAGKLDRLLAPLAHPAVTPEQRAAIESAVQEHAGDLAALAACPALPEDHSLRQAAAALQRSFSAVTSGPVSDEMLALPEVSRRSPLAPWKMLISAIAAFYRRDDEACRKYLVAVPPQSVPARLIPAIEAALDGTIGKALPPASASLVTAITGNAAALTRAIDGLDRSMADSQSDEAILNAIRTAVAECRRSAPERLTQLQRLTAVRAALFDIDAKRIIGAMGGKPPADASYLRLLARGMEAEANLEEKVMACEIWNQFRVQAAEEGLFAPNGPEAAIIYLHMAELLSDVPDEMIRSFESFRAGERGDKKELFYVRAGQLYQRACVLDPRSDAFAQWFEWAKRRNPAQAEPVAQIWNTKRSGDLEPVLYLMNSFASRNLFPSALKYLAKAENIDPLNSEVRRARLRMMTGDVLRQIKSKKLGKAEAAIDAIAALPQSLQGDRPALIAALRSLTAFSAGDSQRTTDFQRKAGELLGSHAAAALLISGLASLSKRTVWIDHPNRLSGAERGTLPAGLARLRALASDAELPLRIPYDYLVETAKQVPRASASLTPEQLRMLGELAVTAGHLELAYRVSAAGLARGNDLAAEFLLLRARSLPNSLSDRRTVCAAAAARLAQQNHNAELVRKAAELVHREIQLTPAQMDEVLATERKERTFRPRRSPNYRSIIGSPCDCPDCRRRRGELNDDLDEDDDLEFPPDMPPEIAAMLLEETARALEKGESLEQLLDRLGKGPVPRPDFPKRRRRR